MSTTVAALVASGTPTQVSVTGVIEAKRKVSSLPLLSPEEHEQVVVEWNQTGSEYPRHRCVHELFEEQALANPAATAAVFEDERFSYAELNRRANRLAHYLRSRGVGPGRRVGLYAERSLEMLVGLLAVLKAGGAYVPVDPGNPPERVRYLLQDSAAGVLLTRGPVRAGVVEACDAITVLNLLEESLWERQPESNPDRSAVGLTSEHLAYVIYTSGSTGLPKGVMVP